MVIKMEKHDRKNNRLAGYDYGQIGAYFVTICTHKLARLFRMDTTVGNGLCAVPEEEEYPPENQIIVKWLKETESKFPNIRIDKYVIMPDHVHLLVSIQEYRIGCALPDVIKFFKTMTTNAYIRGVKAGMLPPFDGKLWQKSYYDHVIRNQQDYDEIWQYIQNNPAKWMWIHENQS